MRHKLGKLDKAPLNIRILLDSGATRSIVFYNAAKKLRLKRDSKRTVWTTLAGQFETNQKTEVLFKLNEFDESTTVRHEFTVCKQKSSYDMIIGVDLMTKLGIILDFKEKAMQWKHVSVPMKSRDATRHTSFPHRSSHTFMQTPMHGSECRTTPSWTVAMPTQRH